MRTCDFRNSILKTPRVQIVSYVERYSDAARFLFDFSTVYPDAWKNDREESSSVRLKIPSIHDFLFVEILDETFGQNLVYQKKRKN